MKKLFLVSLLSIFCFSVSIVGAESNGTIVLDVTPKISAQTTTTFQPFYIKITKLENGTEVTVWRSFVNKSEDINVSLSTGSYKLYLQLHGHKTLWELDNNGTFYTVSPLNNTVVSLWANEPLFREVIADAPWRIEPSKNSIPILIMIKDADGLNPYSLDHIEIYTCNYNANGDCINDRYLVNYPYGVTIGNERRNLYYNGDWYAIYWLPKSGADLYGNSYTLSGRVNFHVGLITPGIWDEDPDAHSYFTVNLASNALPTLPDWYSGDTHFHTYYSDNKVEFGSPVEASIYAGKSIGLDWVTITDHSFDLDDIREDTTDPNDKWNNLIHEYNLYKNDPEFKLILGEEVSAWGSDDTIRHFLVYGMENFNNVGGSRLNFIPGQRDDPCKEEAVCSVTWKLEEVISNVTAQGGVGYGAHPTGQPHLVERWLQRGPWTVIDFSREDYNGLELWNGYGDPNRDSGIEEWKNLLKNGRKDVFISAGTDAHGDFSHATSLDWTGVEASNNAFGKVRTVVYVPGYSQSNVPPQDKIVDALKNGHSIVTDGPILAFTINNKIIGETAAVPSGTKPTLNIEWASTPEFGGVASIEIWKGATLVKTLGLLDFGSATSYSWQDTEGITQNTYYRLVAATPYGRKAYTNPIWVEISEATIGNFTFSEASDSGDSPSDKPYNVQLRISTETVSSLSIQSIAQISESASVINGSTGKGREVDKTKTYPAEKAGYVGVVRNINKIKGGIEKWKKEE